jgi:hypothetical protein
MSIIKSGDIVQCEFLDHVEDGGEPYRFKVWGLLAHKGRSHLEIISWAHADPTVQVHPHNEKRWTIVKAAVIKLTRMETKP